MLNDSLCAHAIQSGDEVVKTRTRKVAVAECFENASTEGDVALRESNHTKQIQQLLFVEVSECLAQLFVGQHTLIVCFRQLCEGDIPYHASSGKLIPETCAFSARVENRASR